MTRFLQQISPEPLTEAQTFRGCAPVLISNGALRGGCADERSISTGDFGFRWITATLTLT
jgi:hypothetical protein